MASNVEVYDDYNFDLNSNQISIAGRPISTTPKMFNLALLLFRNLSRPLSRSCIAQTVWGSGIDPEAKMLDVHIARARRQLGLTPENGFRLSAVYRFGFRLERVPKQSSETH